MGQPGVFQREVGAPFPLRQQKVWVQGSPTLPWQAGEEVAREWIWKCQQGFCRLERVLEGVGVGKGREGAGQMAARSQPGSGESQRTLPQTGVLARASPARHHGPFSPLPPPLFPFSFTDHTLPFKRNATHTQRHKCSSLVSFLQIFFLFCSVLF